MRKIRWLAAATLLTVSVVEAMAAPTEPGWWDERWTRRAPLTLAPSGAALSGVPVVLSGQVLLERAGDEKVPGGSLRVIGPQGEVPCQLDECDGSGSLVSTPNHWLDPDDELSFQADLPAQGDITYWIYWSTRPLPPGRYVSECRVHDPFGPSSLESDIQLHNRAVFMGLRGPSRANDPTQANALNHGTGSLTFLDMYGQRLAGGDWGRKFPRGALFWQPGTEIKKWGLPHPLAQGPVRSGAKVIMDEGQVPIGEGQTARVRVEHRAWLFERGAFVLFEEFITPLEPIARLPLDFSCFFNLGLEGQNSVWTSVKGQVEGCTPSAEQLAQGLEGMKFFTGTVEAWMARYQPASHVLDATLYMGAIRRQGDVRSTGVRGQGQSVVLTANETLTEAMPGETLYRCFWRVAFEGDHGDGITAQALPRVFSPEGAVVGAMQKRGPQ